MAVLYRKIKKFHAEFKNLKQQIITEKQLNTFEKMYYAGQ
jgi:hypothetical protein